MGADYSKFKTPFFEIQIGDSSGKKLFKLPHHVSRLIEKVEIMETFDPPGVDTITLHFIEGSREPASPDASLGTSGLYNIPNSEGGSQKTDISGSLTNRTGILTDLIFSGNSGITFLTAQERKTGKKDDRIQENIIGDSTTRRHTTENSKPTFLFQERNKVSITWGYKEDRNSERTIQAYILHIGTSFPESGPSRTVITCQATAKILDQVAPEKGINFGEVDNSTKGFSLVTFKDLPTDELIKNLCTKTGMECIVSKDLSASIEDKDKQKVWMAGESFNQFMSRLAENQNCYYTTKLNPKTGKDTIIFIKKEDFEGQVIIADKSLTTYKAPGTLLRSVDVKIDYSGLPGNTQTGVDKEGKENSTTAGDGQTQVTMYENQSGIPASPVDQGNVVAAVKSLVDNEMGGKYTGTVDVNPSSTIKNKDDKAKTKANDQERKIALDFTLIGYSKFTPGTIEFRNIGVRYSGKYRVITVTHIIDSSGYTTKGTALSFSLSAGGVPNPESQKGKDINDPKVDERLHIGKDTQDSKVTATIRDDYNKFLGIT